MDHVAAVWRSTCGVIRRVEPGRPHRRGKGLAHRAHRLAVPFDDRVARDSEPLPASQMRQQARGQPDGRPPLLRLPGARCTPISRLIESDIVAQAKLVLISLAEPRPTLTEEACPSWVGAHYFQCPILAEYPF
jgi:hypothetical protein